jgi:hypothetical protein
MLHLLPGTQSEFALQYAPYWQIRLVAEDTVEVTLLGLALDGTVGAAIGDTEGLGFGFKTGTGAALGFDKGIPLG